MRTLSILSYSIDQLLARFLFSLVVQNALEQSCVLVFFSRVLFVLNSSWAKNINSFHSELLNGDDFRFLLIVAQGSLFGPDC